MRTKAEIVRDWLPRYTGRDLDSFGKYILLTNFSQYVVAFARRFGVPVCGEGFPIQSASAENLTILNFGMGSPMAATVMDLLAAVSAAIARHGHDYWTGTVFTTNRRVWEHDEAFKDYLVKTRAIGIDMELSLIHI